MLLTVLHISFTLTIRAFVLWLLLAQQNNITWAVYWSRHSFMCWRSGTYWWWLFRVVVWQQSEQSDCVPVYTRFCRVSPSLIVWLSPYQHCWCTAADLQTAWWLASEGESASNFMCCFSWPVAGWFYVCKYSLYYSLLLLLTVFVCK